MSNHSEDVLLQAGNIWKFLDKISVSNPTEYQKFIQNVLKDGEENNLGPPVPKFVLQTTKTPEVIPVRKYFINIAEWKQVPAPKTQDSPVPIVVSEQRKEVVEGEWASIIDVTFNPSVFTAESKNLIENTGLIELALKFIEQKLSIQMSRKYKILDDKYKGNQDNLLDLMCPSALRESIRKNVEAGDESLIKTKVTQNKKGNVNKKEMPKVHESKDEKSEVPSTEETIKMVDFDPMITANLSPVCMTERTTKTVTPAKKTILKRPNLEMIVNKDEQNVEISINLPGVESVNECDLHLAECNLSLLVAGKFELDLDLPVNVLIDDCNAKFIKDQSLLLIVAPYVTNKN